MLKHFLQENYLYTGCDYVINHVTIKKCNDLMKTNYHNEREFC